MSWYNCAYVACSLVKVVSAHGVTAIVDANAVMFLLGTEMDFEHDALSA